MLQVYAGSVKDLISQKYKWFKFLPVRVKDGMSLRNGMWHGVRNGIIMRNTIYAGNKLTEERILFSRQFHKSSSFFDAADSN